MLHREIDQYTDSHPFFKKSASLLFPKYRHYGRVIVDMFYDHFLASNWSSFHKQSLEHYSQNFYKSLKNYSEQLPEDIQKMLFYLVRDDWFLKYKSVDGLDNILKKMAKRTRFESKMDVATQDLELNTKNRDATIKKYNYGPLNVDEPADYWKRIAAYWKTTEEAARKSL